MLTSCSHNRSVRIRLAASAALLAIGISGCSGANVGTPATSSLPGLPTPAVTSSTTPSKSPEAASKDYGRLLLTAADLSDAEDTFTQRSPTAQPKDVPGASAFFVNDSDNRAVGDTVLIYPDAATATATLHQSARDTDHDGDRAVRRNPCRWAPTAS